MLPSTKVTLAGCAAAVALAYVIDGPADGLHGSTGAPRVLGALGIGALGMGIVTGFLAGAGVALSSAVLQKRIAARRPALLVHVLGGGFLIKIFALLALTLCVRFIAPLGAGIEWRAFMLAFAAAVLGLLPCTAWELLRLTQDRAPTRAMPTGVAYQQGTPS